MNIKSVAPDGMLEIIYNKVDKWIEMYGLSTSMMFSVARHYKWREDQLVNWLDEQDTLN